MRERAQLTTMAHLREVDRARRGAAEAALGQARLAEQSARTQEQAALETSREAREQWLACLSRPAFDPEYCRFLSLRLIGREAEAEAAAARTRAAVERRSRREHDWQVAQARLRSGEISLLRLKRKAARRAEERRLADMADRITYSWCRS